MLEMASMFRDSGSPFAANPFGGAGAGGFPAPGVPSTGNTTLTPTPANHQPGVTPAAATGFPSFFPLANANAGLPAAATGPFGAFDPAMMQQMFAQGGLGGAGFGGAAPPTAPADTRSPEERFQVQLQVRLEHI
jgi:ubiquilin